MNYINKTKIIIILVILLCNNIVFAQGVNNSGFSDDELKIIRNKQIVNWSKFGSSNGDYGPLGGDDNWNEPDWDFDGIKNTDEVDLLKKDDIYYFKIKSNPFAIDSDGDGITDYEEINKYKTSPIRKTYNKKNFEGLFENPFDDFLGKFTIGSFRTMYPLLGEDAPEDVAIDVILNILTKGSSEYVKSLFEISDNVGDINDITGLLDIGIGLDLTDTYIKNQIIAKYMTDSKSDLQSNLNILKNMSEKSLFGPTKSASKKIYEQISNNNDLYLDAVKQTIDTYMSQKAIDLIVDVSGIGLIKKISDISVFGIKKLGTIDEQAKEFLEVLINGDIITGIKIEIMKNMDVTKYEGVEYITPKEGKMVEVNELFARYIVAMNNIINSKLTEELENSLIEKFGGEFIANAADTNWLLKLFNVKEKIDAQKLKTEERKKILNDIHLKLSSELERLKIGIEGSLDYDESLNDVFIDNSIYLQKNGLNSLTNGNSIQYLLKLYDEINSKVGIFGGIYKNENGSYTTLSFYGDKPQLPALFDENGNLWIYDRDDGDDFGYNEYLQIKYLNGNDSKKFRRYIECLLRGEMKVNYDNYASEEMFTSYERMEDSYLYIKEKIQ